MRLLASLAICLALCGCVRQSDGLQSVLLQTDSKIKWNKKTGCDAFVVNGCDTICYKGTVKFRGGISSKYPKHSYSLKFSEEHSLCGLPSGKSWILNANYIDKTFMRHKLCYDLFRRMGNYNLASRCDYAMVHENGKNRGLYVVMQRLNRHVLDIDANDDNALIFKDPKVFYNDSMMPPKSSPDENFNEQTYPDFKKHGDKSAILDEFRDFILHSTDSEFEAHIGEWIDMRNVVDWHLLLLFTNNADGVLKNFYLYKKDTGTPFRVAIWDCDHSFGRDGDNELNMLERLTDDRRNILFDRLSDFRWYNDMLSRRWHKLRKSGVISYRKIEKMMQENDRRIQFGLSENTAIWGFDSEFYFDANDYRQECRLMLDFVVLSLEKMDKNFLKK